MGFSRQEYWSGLPFPSLGIFPNPGIEAWSPACRQILYQLSYQGSLEAYYVLGAVKNASCVPSFLPSSQQLVALHTCGFCICGYHQHCVVLGTSNKYNK